MRTAEEVVLVVTRRASDGGGEEFLVCLRSPEKHGYWNPAAGGIEEGESPAEAAQRELREETGLERPLAFEPLQLELRYLRPPESGGFWVRLHPFWVEAPEGWEPTLNEEHVAYRWCSADDAVSLLAYPEAREAVVFVSRRLAVSARSDGPRPAAPEGRE